MRGAKTVDLQKYSGTWHEIDRAPNSFQRECIDGTTLATYKVIDRDTLRVENACDTSQGRRVGVGKAWVVGPRNLRVSFVPFPIYLLRWLPVLSAPYSIAFVDTNYKYAIVRSGSLWWILAREPTVATKSLNHLYNLLESTH